MIPEGEAVVQVEDKYPKSFRHLAMVLDNISNEFHDMHEDHISFVDFMNTNQNL